MNKLALVSVLVVVSLAVGAIECSSSGEWLAYKAKFGKTYTSQVEDSMRHSVFLKNKAMVEQFNAEESKTAGFKKGINQFTDWTEEEIANYNGGVVVPENWTGQNVNTPEAEAYLESILNGNSSSLSIPESFDWRAIPGRVQVKVQDQGRCASSWAYTITGILEGQQGRQLESTVLKPLSAQNVIDCSTRYGCRGWWPYFAMLYLGTYQNGVDNEASYPYENNDYDHIAVCRFKPENAVIVPSGPVALSTDEWKLRTTVARYGPVGATIDLQHDLHDYREGIYKSSKCTDDFHEANKTLGVLIVGYGVDKEHGDYWILKNVWGFFWGESGYFRIPRGKNACGIATSAYIAAF